MFRNQFTNDQPFGSELEFGPVLSQTIESLYILDIFQAASLNFIYKIFTHSLEEKVKESVVEYVFHVVSQLLASEISLIHISETNALLSVAKISILTIQAEFVYQLLETFQLITIQLFVSELYVTVHATGAVESNIYISILKFNQEY
ncbi:hypothetical protein ACFLY2_00610 [Patescibacteria group bacterium]